MKIIEKGVMPVQTCPTCKTKVQLEYKDLRSKIKQNGWWNYVQVTHDVWRCPLCKHQNYVKWQDDES